VQTNISLDASRAVWVWEVHAALIREAEAQVSLWTFPLTAVSHDGMFVALADDEDRKTISVWHRSSASIHN
jgi:hypothetical protein